MSIRGRLSLLGAIAILFAACTGGGATTAPSTATPSEAAPSASESTAPSESASAAPIAGGLLDKVLKAGKIVVSTDPKYPPQSSLRSRTARTRASTSTSAPRSPSGSASTIAFETPSWDALTAGAWSGRWDFSVGSMTITSERQKVLDFSDPYYYTPAQMTASTASGITTLDGLAGKTICVGEATTYLDWLNGELDFGTESPQTTPPAGATATTLSTDRLCAADVEGRPNDFEGWLSSSTTVEAAIKDGLPLVKVGDPVFYEPLAVAVDKAGPDASDMVTARQPDRHGDARRRHPEGLLREVVRARPDRQAGRLTPRT